MSDETQYSILEVARLFGEARSLVGSDEIYDLKQEDGVKAIRITDELFQSGIDRAEIVRRMTKVLQAMAVIRLAADPQALESSWGAFVGPTGSITGSTMVPHGHGSPSGHARSIRLGNSNVYSDDFTPPTLLRRVAVGRGSQLAPLNIVARIVRNMATAKFSTSAFRFMTIDIGDGQETKVKIMRDTDLYHEYGEGSPFARRTIVVLRNIDVAFTETGIYIKFDQDSSASRLVSATWQDTLQWFQAIDEGSIADL